MAQIVLGIGTSHTPMLNAPPTDWPRFIERDYPPHQSARYRRPADHLRGAAEARPRRYRRRRSRRSGCRRGTPRSQAAIVAARRLSARRQARRADRRRRRPGRAVPRRQHAGHPRLLRRDDPQRAARRRLQGPGLGAAGDARAGTRRRSRATTRSTRALARHLIDALIDARIRHRRLGPGARRRGRGPRDRLCPQADDEGRRADRAGLHQHLLPAEPADPAPLLQARPGDPRGGRESTRAMRGSASSARAGSAISSSTRRSTAASSTLLARKDAAGDPGPAAREAQFRQLGNPQLDLRRRRGRASVARMVALRAGLPHPGRHRHRPRLRLLVVIMSAERSSGSKAAPTRRIEGTR